MGYQIPCMAKYVEIICAMSVLDILGCVEGFTLNRHTFLLFLLKALELYILYYYF